MLETPWSKQHSFWFCVTEIFFKWCNLLETTWHWMSLYQVGPWWALNNDSARAIAPTHLETIEMPNKRTVQCEYFKSPYVHDILPDVRFCHEEPRPNFFFFLNKRSKWKADRAAVTSLCVSPDGKMLLSAGQVIKMWDLDTKEVYRVSLCTTCSLFSLIYHHHKLRSVHLWFQENKKEAALK